MPQKFNYFAFVRPMLCPGDLVLKKAFLSPRGNLNFDLANDIFQNRSLFSYKINIIRFIAS